jgi:hypothetical protein
LKIIALPEIVRATTAEQGETDFAIIGALLEMYIFKERANVLGAAPGK